MGAKKLLLSASPPAVFFECDNNETSDLIHQILFDAGYNFLNMSNFKKVDKLVHNNLALHTVNHSDLIAKLLSK